MSCAPRLPSCHRLMGRCCLGLHAGCSITRGHASAGPAPPTSHHELRAIVIDAAKAHKGPPRTKSRKEHPCWLPRRLHDVLVAMQAQGLPLPPGATQALIDSVSNEVTCVCGVVSGCVAHACVWGLVLPA